ncbi:hypothetical protein CCMSSC00406_0005937 [Pleurotus cornucopiae]|uniref:Uncharacterized protein n=1 Tax=Pleurotus cornucopiae TaxID=5321 RepID=A0ACB7IMQ0_PLECO|nr:hypothetical protein CCMSSC00406_0005937 [Pleurotus cornucopiae]
MFSFLLSLTVATITGPTSVVSYDLVRDYSGQTFFDGWDFFGSWDNLTLGDVWWLNRNDAFTQGLVHVNDAQRAVLKVDNVSNVPFNEKRASIRITTQEAYGVGSLWVLDAVHLPFGCSVGLARLLDEGDGRVARHRSIIITSTVRAAFTDEDAGEIDIMEGINLMTSNQMALHTLPGCTHTTPPNQMGITRENDCSEPSGCVVAETSPGSLGAPFAAAGGGVWAVQFDVAGVFMWFWGRANIPPSVIQATSTSPLDVSQWGPPSASYPSTSCNITQFFSAQNIVLDITLCGSWAGLPEQYTPACGSSGPTGICYNDNVVGPGARFDDAFFEINYLRAYTTGGVAPTPSAAPTAIGTALIVDGAATITATTNVQLTPTPVSRPNGGVPSDDDEPAGEVPNTSIAQPLQVPRISVLASLTALLLIALPSVTIARL